MNGCASLEPALAAAARSLRLRHVAGPGLDRLHPRVSGGVTAAVATFAPGARQPLQVVPAGTRPDPPPPGACLVLCQGAPDPGSAPDTTTILRTCRNAREALDVLGLALAPSLETPTIQHGVLLRQHDVGILITGAAGVGKGVLALALIDRGAALVADDAVELYPIGRERVGGLCPEVLRSFLEVRPLGLLDVAALYRPAQVVSGSAIDLWVELDPAARTPATSGDRLRGPLRTRTLLQAPVPVLRLRPGADGALLVAAAARRMQLGRARAEPAESLRQRHRRHMRGERG